MSALALRQMAQFERKGFTEKVVYLPNDGKALSIDALVDRSPNTDMMNTSVPFITVTVMNDQIYGIDPDIMDRGADQIEVAERHGGTLQARDIQQILEHDEEWITLLVS